MCIAQPVFGCYELSSQQRFQRDVAQLLNKIYLLTEVPKGDLRIKERLSAFGSDHYPLYVQLTF